jgi:hypothetical protein
VRHAERIIGLVVGYAATVLVCLVGPVVAKAAVTSSTLAITAPTSPYLIDDQRPGGNELISVGGTTQGLANSNVDIKCYSAGGSQALATSVHVDASGNYQLQNASFRVISRQTCVLRAVPAGDNTDYPPGSASPYSGPVVNLGQATQTTVAGGPNAGKLEYYYLYNSQPVGAFEYASLGGCSISESYNYDPVTYGGLTQFNTESLDFCNAWFSWANGGTKAGQAPPTRSELRVDGLDAYVAGNAFGINGLSTFNNPGFPDLSYSYSVDPTTGNLSLDETDEVVRCSPGGLFPPTSSSCSSFVPTGIQVTMHIVQNQSGRVAEVVQRFQSTDGAAHTVDLLEDNDFYHRNHDGELNFPWTGGGMQPYTVPGQDLPGPSASGPGSFYVRGSASVPDGSELAPQGQVTFSNPPAGETIVATTNNSVNASPSAAISWVDLHYLLTVPAGGSVPLGFSYSNGYSSAQTLSDAASAQANFRPTVSIASPQSGIDTARPVIGVSGTAADATGLSDVTVNGHAVTVGANGIWNAIVGLSPGLNTITAVASNVFGNAAQTRTTVVYVPPPAVAGLHQAHRKWREGGPRPRRGHPKTPIGTTFSWKLNEPAQLRFVFTQQVPGRRSAGACVAQSRRNRLHRRCTRTITVGTHNAPAGPGAGKWTFKGRMANGLRLKPGTYTVTIVARNATTGAQSNPVRLRFTIVQ